MDPRFSSVLRFAPLIATLRVAEDLTTLPVGAECSHAGVALVVIAHGNGVVYLAPKDAAGS